MDAQSLGRVAASLVVMLSLLGVHATPSPVLRCGLLAIAAGALVWRWFGVARNRPLDLVERLADVLMCIGFAFVAGPKRGLVLALIAMVACVVTPPSRGRLAIAILGCGGGIVVVVVSRLLHIWMQGVLGALILWCVGFAVWNAVARRRNRVT